MGEGAVVAVAAVAEAEGVAVAVAVAAIVAVAVAVGTSEPVGFVEGVRLPQATHPGGGLFVSEEERRWEGDDVFVMGAGVCVVGAVVAMLEVAVKATEAVWRGAIDALGVTEWRDAASRCETVWEPESVADQ